MLPLRSHRFKIRYGPEDDALHDFYLPALERSIRYARTAGFFSAPTLAAAATGIVRLIAGGGSMRLLCGARLAKSDLEALRSGAALEPRLGDAMVRLLGNPRDPALKGRLEALAWMLAHRHLAIRVVLPLGADGHPLPGPEAYDYYQPREGVFYDAAGHKLGFTGSGHETKGAWQHGPETCLTITSWDRRAGAAGIPASPLHIEAIERRFEELWEGVIDGWIALDLPAAPRERLLAFCPAQAPVRDPLERPAVPVDAVPATPAAAGAERLVLRFLREAPFLPNAQGLGIETSAVKPWPHQLRVVRQAVERYPESFLFCDEVGLGKTIEAGLALRQLVISGRVRRALLLVPKSVLRQWQEELYEKLALNVPRYDGGALVDAFGRELAASAGAAAESVWNVCPLLLASSQLAKRRERRAELLAAEPWDLVIVDEAHHARRKELRTDRYRPNRLLELLAGGAGGRGLRDRTRCLYLLTATPMQVHAVEVWDLLKLLGLGGRWGALEGNFLGFFRELRRPFPERDWDFLLDLLADYLEAGGELDPAFSTAAAQRLGPERWAVVRELPHADERLRTIAELDPAARAVVDEMLRRHTPLRTFAWRNTRALLRTYRMQGLLDANVPERRPQNVWIALRDDERALYERVEEYISDFYERYEAERRGLGFVMTVFRRRLTSSFYALRRSLERRRAFLDAGETAGFDLSDDDLEEDELELDVGEKLDGDAAEQLRSEHRQAELAYLDQFLDELAALGHDSKLERLRGDLRDLLGDGDEREAGSEHRTVLVFTQYTDTMDYLRDELRRLYGARVACYSGRGGEVWDGTAWVLRSKELLKDAFRRGDEVRILLCTESASEGLNLQTCGELVNFDMPWNPMQVEQRIGRIDRIGQRFREVRIRNYFYEDTVEATIYQRLGERIGWFEDVVGELEPILHRVGEAIRKVAMVTGKRRTRRLEEELVALRRGLGKRTADAPDLAALLADLPAVETAEPSPVTLPQLEAVLVGSEVLGRCFTPDPAIAGAYRLREGDGESLVSFSPAVFDRYPNTVELLTYGNPRLAALLASAGDPEDSEEPTGIGLYRTLSPLPVSVFVHPASGVAEPIPGLDRLRALAAAGGGRWTGSEEGQAAALVSQVRQRMLRTTARVEENRRRAERLALVEAARQVLVRSALIELAAAQSPGLFEEVLPYGFGAEAVRALGRRGQPFRALLRLTGDAGIEARSSDPFFVAVQGRSSGRLRRKAEALVREGNEIVEKIAALDRVTAAAQAEVRAPSVAGILERQWFPLLPEVVATAEPSQVPPLRILEPAEVRPFKNSVPLYEELDTPASRFAEESTGEEVPQADELRNPGDYRWVQLAGRTRPARGLFVSRVMGEAMNRRIPDGVWGLFRLHPQGSHHGKVVLARHREIHDPELGGAWTLRIYERDEGSSADGSWQHRRVVLKPASTDPGYEPIVLEEVEEGVLKIVAEFVEIVG